MSRSIEELVAGHPFFAGLPPTFLALAVACARNERHESGTYLARTGEPADRFFLIRSGAVAVETHDPVRGRLVVQTLHAGDLVGWSWLFPPYAWTFDLRVVEPTLALAVDGKCLRDKCNDDPRLGYMVVQRLARIMTERLRSTRLQLLDVYGGERTP